MGISLKQAFIFVPQDKNWVSKVLIGGLLLFFPVFAFIFPGIKRMIFDPINYYMVTMYSLLVLVCLLAISGYFFKVVHNRIVHENGRMPSWRFIAYFIHIGFKSYVGGFIFSIPFLLVMGLMLFISPLTFNGFSAVLLAVGTILYVIYTAMYIMLALNFAIDFKISSFFNIKKAFALIQHNLINYVILVCECILVSLCMLILSVLLVNGQILGLLLPFVSFYICLVYADLFAQFALGMGNEIYKEANCYL